MASIHNHNYPSSNVTTTIIIVIIYQPESSLLTSEFFSEFPKFLMEISELSIPFHLDDLHDTQY